MFRHPTLRATSEDLSLYSATLTTAQQAEFDKWDNFMTGGKFEDEFGDNSTNCFEKMFYRFNRKTIMLADQLDAAADSDDAIASMASFVQYTANDAFFCTDALENASLYFYDKYELFGGTFAEFIIGFFVYLGSRVGWITIYLTDIQNELAKTSPNYNTIYRKYGNLIYTIYTFEPS